MVGLAVSEEYDDLLIFGICAGQICFTVDNGLRQIQAVVCGSRAGGMQTIYRGFKIGIIARKVADHLGLVCAPIVADFVIAMPTIRIAVIREFDDRDFMVAVAAGNLVDESVHGIFHCLKFRGPHLVAFA